MVSNFTVRKASFFISLLVIAAVSHAQHLVYITGSNKIGVIANPANPETVTGPFNITGIPAGQIVEAIDYRPLTGELFGLGYNASTQETQLYIIDQTSAFASPVGASNILDLVAGKIGFDFNPTVDRIRVTSSNGNNYRLNPNNGNVVASDGNLAYNMADTNAGIVPSVIASAYSRSYIGSEITTLYNIDFSQNSLTTQFPPNAGTLNTVGSLGLVFHIPNATVGFDIFYDGIADVETAYINANTNNSNDSLYTLNISTGQLMNKGAIGNGLNVRDIAAVINLTLPEITGVETYALTGLNNLISFDSDLPSIIRSWKPIIGINAGQVLLGMDFRPATNELFALGFDAPFSQYQLYKISTSDGIATAVNPSPIGIELDSSVAAFDFNPVVDRIRVVGAAGENYQINPEDGILAGVDADVTFAVGDINAGQNPSISTVAYSNSYPGALATSLFSYDQNLNSFGTITSPNTGIISTTGSSGLTVAGASLDVFFDLTNYENKIFFASNGTSSSFDVFYTVESNIFHPIGKIGFGIPVKDIAVVVGDAPANLDINESSANYELGVYPNPTTDFLNLKVEDMFGQFYKINNVAGQTLLSNTIKSGTVESIDVSAFSAGVYFLMIEDGTTIKWIKK